MKKNLGKYYQSGEATSWTRIDMLLKLYDASIMNSQQAIADVEALASTSASGGGASPVLLKSVRLISELRNGLNFRYQEMAERFDQLLEFVQHSLLTMDVAKMRAGVQVLETLRSGFQEIYEEAVRLEKSGEIPPLSATANMEVVV